MPSPQRKKSSELKSSDREGHNFDAGLLPIQRDPNVRFKNYRAKTLKCWDLGSIIRYYKIILMLSTERTPKEKINLVDLNPLYIGLWLIQRSLISSVSKQRYKQTDLTQLFCSGRWSFLYPKFRGYVIYVTCLGDAKSVNRIHWLPKVVAKRKPDDGSALCHTYEKLDSPID